ncbi:hypothetical protein P154DRAFT_224049 [Amniculicola lignicola CBS 123094]|uniref:Uncharacterized protein n=1 Tax=Amniculicola lignicola CBS 123094 TaxID=1392246 RepID=A0A6A5WY46_9PLEO|nr:hypothetical protein P154DRAFT_224049 [Amniculicola lignicola CBS 123094]
MGIEGFARPNCAKSFWSSRIPSRERAQTYNVDGFYSHTARLQISSVILGFRPRRVAPACAGSYIPPLQIGIVHCTRLGTIKTSLEQQSPFSPNSLTLPLVYVPSHDRFFSCYFPWQRRLGLPLGVTISSPRPLIRSLGYAPKDPLAIQNLSHIGQKAISDNAQNNV